MKLHRKVLGEGEPLIILHGVFGSGDNWISVGKQLSEKFKVYLVDQRNHGQSPHSEEFDYDVMADDLMELIRDEGYEKVNLIGHSMGGKTVMNFCIRYPEFVDKFIVVDIAPRYYPPHHKQIFAAFRSLDLSTLESRRDAELQMEKVIADPGIRLFLLKNLARNGDGFGWKLNLDVIEQKAEVVGSGIDPNGHFDGAGLFIGGAKSDYIQAEDVPIISKHFPNARIEMIEGAGHWVHAEKPEELLRLAEDFLQ